jgi:hypothetical protein
VRALIRAAYCVATAAHFACERLALPYSHVYIIRPGAAGELDQHQQRKDNVVFHISYLQD